MLYFIIVFVIETILFYWLIIMENCFDRVVMWRQFIIFKEFVRLRTKVKSSSGIINPLSPIMSDVDHIIY